MADKSLVPKTLRWTEAREIAFLQTIQTEGAHMTNNANVTERWNKTIASLLRQQEFAEDFKPFWIKKDKLEHRPFREKFTRISNEKGARQHRYWQPER